MRKDDLDIYINFPFPHGFPEEWRQPIRNILIAEALRKITSDLDGSFIKIRCTQNKMIDRKTIGIVAGAITLLIIIFGFILRIKGI